MRNYRIFSLLLCLSLTACSYGKADIDTVHSTAGSDSVVVVTEQSMAVQKQSRIIFAMDTVMELTVYADNETVLDQAAERITELENKLSVTMPDSEIYVLNNTGSKLLSKDTAYLLESALTLCKSTNGALDITVYPAVSAWGFTTGEYKIPSATEVAELLKNVDYRKVTLYEQTASIPYGVQVDLGSVAKGYTGDILSELLKENGITSALLNLGGNVQAVGNKTDGTPWRIAVKHPTDTKNYLGILSISDMAAITSGGYERYFVGEDGGTYWHILDPSTGKPADSGLLSVTVVGKSGLLCDAMSTALFVMGLDDAVDYWRIQQEFEAIFVTDDGKIYITAGLDDCFTVSAQYTTSEVTVIRR